MLNLYLLTSGISGLDSYSDILVAAKDEDTARSINPIGVIYNINNSFSWHCGGAWRINPGRVKCTLIGKADNSIEPNAVIITSFNAA